MILKKISIKQLVEKYEGKKLNFGYQKKNNLPPFISVKTEILDMILKGYPLTSLIFQTNDLKEFRVIKGDETISHIIKLFGNNKTTTWAYSLNAKEVIWVNQEEKSLLHVSEIPLKDFLKVDDLLPHLDKVEAKYHSDIVNLYQTIYSYSIPTTLITKKLSEDQIIEIKNYLK